LGSGFAVTSWRGGSSLGGGTVAGAATDGVDGLRSRATCVRAWAKGRVGVGGRIRAGVRGRGRGRRRGRGRGRGRGRNRVSG